MPVFAADIKGDLSGIAERLASPRSFWSSAQAEMGLDNEPDQRPSRRSSGMCSASRAIPIRATVLDMGPLLLSRMLELNEVQEGVLNIAFRVAADDGLRCSIPRARRPQGPPQPSCPTSASMRRRSAPKYGNVAKATRRRHPAPPAGAGEPGRGKFFGEPALELTDFIEDRPGRARLRQHSGTADKLMQNPRLYSTFLLWLLSELFEKLPEVGDTDKPKLVSSSTRRISCSTTRRRRCSRRSSRLCA